MRNKTMKSVLEAFLQMVSALSQEIGTMSRAEGYTDREECLMLVDEIRLVCQESIKNLQALEQRLMASGLAPPQESRG